MSLHSRIATWWKAVFRPAELDGQLTEELRFHIESYAEDLMRAGVARDEAMRRACAELGSLAATSENCRAAWGTRLSDELCSDLRYALRMLAKSPGFAVIAVGSLALGIGANTAIFSIAKQALLDRLNIPHAEQLRLLEWTSRRNSAVHSIWGDLSHGKDGIYSTVFPYPVYQVLRKENIRLSDLFAFKDAGEMNVTVGGEAEIVRAELVSGNYYEQMAIQPQLGRAIEPADDEKPGGSPVITISDGYWRRRFNRSPLVLGRTLVLNLVSVTIIGVNPPGFTGAASVQISPDIFAPLTMQPLLIPRNWQDSLLSSPAHWWLHIMARTRPGSNDTAAQAALTVTLQNTVRASLAPKSSEAIPRLLVVDGSRGLNQAGAELSQPLLVLSSLVALVLLLACANIANLLLARSAARQREMGVRLALGARRARIVRQVLTESLLLSLLGGIGGILVGYVGSAALMHMISRLSENLMMVETALNWQAFAFTAGLSLLTGLLFGVGPAWQATRTEVNASLKNNLHTSTRRRRGYAGRAIVGIQIAISMLLVAGAGISLRTLINLSLVNPGFNPKHLVLFAIRPPASRYPFAKEPALYGQIEQRLAAIPGVDSVAAASVPLLANEHSMDDFAPIGTRPLPGGTQSELDMYVGDRFFATMQIPILAGRGFVPQDTQTSLRVAVINRALADEYYPGENPIGRTFSTSDLHGTRIVYQIVGVCANTRYSNLRETPPPIYYLNYRQAPDVMQGMTFAVRTGLSRAALTPSLRRAVQAVDRDLPLIDVRTQEEQIDSIMTGERIFADLTGGFGILALALACIGIYGIMAYTVAQRTNEIGIRMAMGARPERILRMVLAEAFWLSAMGIVAGVAGALAIGRLIASMLYGLKPWDPATFVASALLLILVAAVASWIPARRAASVDPMRALRCE